MLYDSAISDPVSGTISVTQAALEAFVLANYGANDGYNGDPTWQPMGSEEDGLRIKLVWLKKGDAVFIELCALLAAAKGVQSLLVCTMGLNDPAGRALAAALPQA